MKPGFRKNQVNGIAKQFTTKFNNFKSPELTRIELGLKVVGTTKDNEIENETGISKPTKFNSNYSPLKRLTQVYLVLWIWKEID